MSSLQSIVRPLLLLTLLTAFSFALTAQEKGKVVRMVDGDTMVLLLNEKEERVRLIGIDTPESRDNAKARRDSEQSGKDIAAILALGKASHRFAETLVSPGDEVTLEFDVTERDRYGRLLAYVRLSNGTMLNEEMVKAGYAGLMTIPPNVKYEMRFRALYRQAVEEKRGLWAE